MKKIVLLTGSELRHEFFRKFLSHNYDGINVLSTYCESTKGNISDIIKNDDKSNTFRINHLIERESNEKDFFGVFCKNIKDKSNPIFIERGEINNLEHVENIIHLNPDIIISYGCSIIKSELVSLFNKKFINIHLGLSPYYRGTATNFWPFVNNELQFIGTTFMHIDQGVDTGEIIHQIRAEINFNDNIHQIGNRVIRDSFDECIKLIKSFDKIKTVSQIKIDKTQEKYYSKKDFKEDTLKKAYLNISKGCVKKYLQKKVLIDSQFPIIKNPYIL